MNRIRNVILVCAMGLVFSASDAPAAQSAANDPLQLVPAESLFCVRINKFNTTMGQLDQFLTGLAPFGVSMLAQMQLAQLLGGPEPSGVNMSGDFALFGPLPGGDAPNPARVGILVPMSDYQTFAKNNPNVTAPDAAGLSWIGPKDNQELVVINVGNYALVTTAGNRQALVETKTWIPKGASSLAQRLGAEEAKRAQSSPVWLYANIQAVHKTFGPMIEAKIQEAKQMMDQLKNMGQAPPMAANMGSIMDMYSGVLGTFMKETQSASLSFEPTATALRLELAVATLPQTELAKIFTASSTPMDRTFTRYLQNGAVMSFLAAVDPTSWNQLNNWGINLLAQMAGKPANDPEIQKIRKFATDGTNALGGTLAASMSLDTKSKPPFAFRYVVGLKDAQAFSRMLDQIPSILNSGLVAGIYQQMGIKLDAQLQRKVETYKDVPIDALTFILTPTDPNSPEGQVIASMYGQGMNLRIATVNNLLVYTLGADPSAAMKELIDQVRSASSTAGVPSEIQAATQLIPGSEKAQFFATYNLLRLIQMGTTIAPMPIAIPPVKSQSNIAIAGNAANGRLSVQVALPKQHLQELMGTFMQTQRQN
ncbi:MAG TPA: hypothetical protein PKZ07_09290 [Sedimentisphaerales bacterium]|nr:hypothetical protein [Sedimentisphaerales bacterium]